MTPNQEKWLTALESNEYQQGKGYLHSQNNKFCCLGVAADLFKTTPSTLDDTAHYLYNGHKSLAPRFVIEALHLYNSTGDALRPVDRHMSLTALNDSGYSFKEIAKIIRDDPRNFFTRTEE